MISFFSFFFVQYATAQECPSSKINRINKVITEDIDEASGLVTAENGIWVHNDSGDSPTLYHVGFDGSYLGQANIGSAYARDWEEMTTFVREGKTYFLIGDIGDNKSRKEFTTYYVIAAPEKAQDVEVLYSFTAKYSVGPQDAEAMFVDPNTEELIVLTKGRDGSFYWLKAPLPTEKSDIVLELFHQEKWSDVPPKGKRQQAKFITAADMSPDGRWIVIRNYLMARMWYHPEGQELSVTIQQMSCRIPLPLQEQGETIAFSTDGKSLWTLSEGTNQPLYQITLNFE